MGGGRMCEIWHAEDMSLGREVAIKTVRLSDQTDPNAFSILLHEGKLLARLYHPGIFPIHDVGSDRGAACCASGCVTCEPIGIRSIHHYRKMIGLDIHARIIDHSLPRRGHRSSRSLV